MEARGRAVAETPYSVWVLVGPALVETRTCWRERREDGLWTRTGKQTNWSLFTSTMSFVVPTPLLPPCMVTETNVWNKRYSLTKGLI